MRTNARTHSTALVAAAVVASFGLAGTSLAQDESGAVVNSFHDYDMARALNPYPGPAVPAEEAGLINGDFASDELSPGDIVAADIARVRVPDGFINPQLVPAGVTDHDGSYTRSGFEDEFAIPGDWIIATVQVAAPPDCSTWGIESTIAWAEAGRTPAEAAPEAANDPVAGFTGVDSFKLETCRPFDEHSLQVEGQWQRFQSLITQTTLSRGAVYETRFMIPPRQNSGISRLRLIGFGFDFENSQANPDTVHFEFIDVPIEDVPLVDWTDLSVASPGPSEEFIAGTPPRTAIPFTRLNPAPEEQTDDSDAQVDSTGEPGAESTSESPATTAVPVPANTSETEAGGETDEPVNDGESGDATSDEPANTVTAGSLAANDSESGSPESGGGLSAGAVLAAGLTVAGFGIAVPGWLLWQRKKRGDAERKAASVDAHRRVKQSIADNEENDRRLYRDLVDAAIEEGQEPVFGRVNISRELYDRVILFGYADDPDIKLHIYDSIGTQGRAEGDPDEFDNHDHFSIDVETLHVRSGWDEKFADKVDEGRARRARKGGPPKPDDPESGEPMNLDGGLPPA